ncbi:hypothetical protein HUJ04_001556 [Dendroctonus ponderosae]|nr:hypothetical protein HUJ04_001556 [Dendroctonus ponderosae]
MTQIIRFVLFLIIIIILLAIDSSKEKSYLSGNCFSIIIQQQSIFFPIFSFYFGSFARFLPIKVKVNFGRLTEAKKTLKIRPDTASNRTSHPVKFRVSSMSTDKHGVNRANK